MATTINNTSVSVSSSSINFDATNITGTLTDSTIFPTGHVIQTAHMNFTNAIGFNTNQTERIPITGFYKDFTPKFSNSMILLEAHLSVGFSSTPEWSWFIDADISTSVSSFLSSNVYTRLGVAARFDNKMNGYHGGPQDTGGNHYREVWSFSNKVSHLPASTNIIRYQVCFSNLWDGSGYYYINRSDEDGNNGYMTRGSSNLTITEIKQ